MKRRDEEVVRARLVEKYSNLGKALHDFVEELQELEPGGTLTNGIEVESSAGAVNIAYVAKPLQVTIENGGKWFVLKSVDYEDPDDPRPLRG